MKLKNKELISLLYQMLFIRRFEEKIARMHIEGKLTGMLHLYIGEEAIAVGVCSALGRNDYITSTHRGHGHLIAKGGNIKLMMAELMGKTTGYCKGKGGSMHITDIELGHLGANGIVGGGLAIATGAGLACLIKKTNQVVVCFFGDGAINGGQFHESLNLAGLWKLPVIYVCENNLYALSTSVKEACAIIDIAKKAQSYNMPGVTVDGMDVLAVRKAVDIAVSQARNGEGPTLIVSQTYRFLGHSRSDSCPYRTKEEEKMWKTRCPISTFRGKLFEQGIMTKSEMEELEGKIERKIEESVKFGERSPFPAPEELEVDVYA